MAVRVVLLVCVGSWSFGVRIVLRLSFWIPEFLRKVLKFFEIFSQLSVLIGKPNQPVHWVRFSGTAVLGTLLCLYWFLVIRSRNCTTFILLDS